MRSCEHAQRRARGGRGAAPSRGRARPTRSAAGRRPRRPTGWRATSRSRAGSARAATPRRGAAAARRRARATISTRPSSCWSTPPRRRSSRRAPCGPESSAVLASTSASSALPADGGDRDEPGPRRPPGRGVEQVVGEAAVLGAPDPRADARRSRRRRCARAAGAPRLAVRALLHRDVPRPAAADGEVAAAGDRVADAGGQRRGGEVGGQPLAEAARSRAARRGARTTRPSPSSPQPVARPAGGAARPGGAAGPPASASSTRAGATPAREARVAGGLELAEQRRVDQAAAAPRPPTRRRDARGAGAADAGTAGRGSALSAAQLAVGAKRESAASTRLDARADAVGERLELGLVVAAPTRAARAPRRPSRGRPGRRGS